MCETAKADDISRNETTERRMARVCLVAMNSINPDLTFTVEVCSDFPDNRLPTLDFLLWPEWWGINHSFFEKAMRTPYLTMQRSAMSDHQRYSILSIDLVRRLSNINIGKVSQDEVLKVVEKFILLLVTSGYDRPQAREAVVSGIKGWKAKVERRKKEKRSFYRPAASTLSLRYRKKLTAKTSWYKDKKKATQQEYEMDEEEREEWRQ